MIKIRHKRFPLEKSLPKGLYYSFDPIKAKKLIHIKNNRRRLIAIRRSYFFDLEHAKDKKQVIEGFKYAVRSIEERYVDITLPRQIVLILIRNPRRSKG
jgi:hypothetical protein